MNFSQADEYKIFAQRHFDHLSINRGLIINEIFKTENYNHNLGKVFYNS